MAPSTIKLAFWQLRQTWRLLLVTGVGIIAAVMLACAVPLYSQVAMTAGARSALTGGFGGNVDIVVRSSSRQISMQFVNKATQELNSEVQKNLGPFLGSIQMSINTQLVSILAPRGGQGEKNNGLVPTRDKVELIGEPVDQATPHLELLQGRLPQVNSNNIEIAINADTANLLHMRVGSILPIRISLVDINGNGTSHDLNLQIVGIFQLPLQDQFWHGEDFEYSAPSDFVTYYKALVSNSTLLSVLTPIYNQAASKGFFNFDPSFVFWHYNVDVSRIAFNNLNAVQTGINNVRVDNANNTDLEQSPFLEQSQTYLPTDILDRYSSRISVSQIPLASLLVLMLGLILFFVSMMADLLVERQAGAIAVLRSRGASRRQVFASLLTQGLAVGLIALVVGPFLTITTVRLLVQHLLPPGDQGALNIIDNPIQVAIGLGLFALAAVAVAILTMILSLNRALRLDVLAMRREAARSTRRPLWQRLNLDVGAVIVALVAYGFSIYMTNSGVIVPQLRLLLLSPLSLVESVFLLIACMLLFLRFFPQVLRLGAWFAMRSRNASPMVALAQMARSPGQSVRMTLLLALATAFAIFTLVFTASQAQRIPDVAAYQSGADFSGAIPGGVVTSGQLAGVKQAYNQLPGVISSSLGYGTIATVGGRTLGISVDFRAVDTDTFAQTADWSQQNSSLPLSLLIAQLRSQRISAIKRKVVPAIVDANTWDTLHLSPGATFTLNFSLVDFEDLVNFVAIAEVQHIPTPDNTSTPGVLADYSTFNTVKGKTPPGTNILVVPLNYIWLRTKDDAASLASVRNALFNGTLRLDPVYDRRAIIDELSNDPIYLALAGILGLGAALAILLALGGNLIASWLSARSRLTNFAVLRALGSTPRQVASVLTWEQAIIYTTAMVLGILFGILLSALVLPALIFTSVASGVSNGTTSGEFYAIQNVPPIQLIIPTSLILALVVLVIICILAIAIMVRVVSRPSLSQSLRLNED